MTPQHALTAIVPCNDLEAPVAFYARLGFLNDSEDGHYRILSDGTLVLVGWPTRLRG